MILGLKQLWVTSNYLWSVTAASNEVSYFCHFHTLESVFVCKHVCAVCKVLSETCPQWCDRYVGAMACARFWAPNFCPYLMKYYRCHFLSLELIWNNWLSSHNWFAENKLVFVCFVFNLKKRSKKVVWNTTNWVHLIDTGGLINKWNCFCMC